MKSINFTLLKLTIAYSIGISIGYTLKPDFWIALIVFFSVFLTLGVLQLVDIKRQLLSGVLAYLCFLCLGTLLYQSGQGFIFDTHYTNKSLALNQPQITRFTIVERLKPNAFYNSYVIELLAIDNKNCFGTSLLSIPIKSDQDLEIGSGYLAILAFKTLLEPKNPGQFSYKKHLVKSGILHQAAVVSQPKKIAIPALNPLKKAAYQIRTALKKKLNNHTFSPAQLALINALFLGQRQDISEHTYTNFVDAGAVHILAISGLHIGILVLLLQYALNPLYLLRHGKLIKLILILCFLWSFALISGLSASTVRAVTMFSIIVIGFNLKRPASIYNTLIVSAFLLLLLKPEFLFDVGFQLSYMAVFSIVTLYPKLSSVVRPKNKLLKFMWSTLAVTLSAQIGVLPLSVYYFNQIPGLFFVSNVILVPALGFILSFGFITLALAFFSILPKTIADCFGGVLDAVLTFTEYIASFKSFVLTDISFQGIELICSYFLLASVLIWVYQRTYKTGVLALVFLLLCQAVQIGLEIEMPKTQFIVFHDNKSNLIAVQNKRSLMVYSDALTAKEKNMLSDFKTKNRVSKLTRLSKKNALNFEDNLIITIDATSIYSKALPVDYVVLQDSPKLNLERLITTLKPKGIIASGTNYDSYVNRWKATCVAKKIPFHATKQKGAYVLSAATQLEN